MKLAQLFPAPLLRESETLDIRHFADKAQALAATMDTVEAAAAWMKKHGDLDIMAEEPGLKLPSARAWVARTAFLQALPDGEDTEGFENAARALEARVMRAAGDNVRVTTRELQHEADRAERAVLAMDADQLDDWYEKNVGYRLRDDDPSYTLGGMRYMAAANMFYSALPDGVDTPGSAAFDKRLHSRLEGGKTKAKPVREADEGGSGPGARLPVGAVDVTKLRLPELLDLYVNAGYLLSASERRDFIKSRYVATGKSGRNHSYLVLCHNPEAEEGADDSHYVTRLYVHLSDDGKLKAEPQGMPDFEGHYVDAERFFNTGEKRTTK
jgi:hypothetical protein